MDGAHPATDHSTRIPQSAQPSGACADAKIPGFPQRRAEWRVRRPVAALSRPRGTAAGCAARRHR